MKLKLLVWLGFILLPYSNLILTVCNEQVASRFYIIKRLYNYHLYPGTNLTLVKFSKFVNLWYKLYQKHIFNLLVIDQINKFVAKSWFFFIYTAWLFFYGYFSLLNTSKFSSEQHCSVFLIASIFRFLLFFFKLVLYICKKLYVALFTNSPTCPTWS